jgi:hypothetical protein
MFVILNYGALKAALPDMAAGLVVPVVALRVRHQQALDDATYRRAARPQEQMKVIAHQAIAVELERLAVLEVGKRGEKGLKVGRLAKDTLAIVATIDYVVNQAVVDWSQGAWHSGNVADRCRAGQENSSDPNGIKLVWNSLLDQALR